MKLRNLFAIVCVFIGTSNLYAQNLDPKDIIRTAEKMSRYADEVDLNQDRSIYPSYVAPIKVSSKAEFEQVKKLMKRLYLTEMSSYGDIHRAYCNGVGAQFAYLDFLKLNKNFGKDNSKYEIMFSESEIKQYSSLVKSETGKTCKEIFHK